MSLSVRGQDCAVLGPDLTIWRVLKDLWDPTDNPNGYVSLGVAENALMHDELTAYINANVQLPPNGLTYDEGGAGSKVLRTTLASFLTRKLNPAVPIDASHVCVTNGVSGAIEHLSNLLTDADDVFLLGRPYYGPFIDDIELRTGAKVFKVAFDDLDPLSVEAVGAYEKAIAECQSQGQNVRGLMLCNPHNPLGRCYPREFLVKLMALCQKHQIHLVSDEIYAMSVFPVSESDGTKIAGFTSMSSIPTDGLIDPALTHVLWGLSKDFGANGLRLGCIISQHNRKLHDALIATVIYTYTSSLTAAITTHMLSDNTFVDTYIDENCRRLARHYGIVKEWAETHGIEYATGVNAAFFIWVNLGKANLTRQNKYPSGESLDGKLTDFVMDKLMQQKIFLASGSAFGSEKPGWFRIVFSQREDMLREGLDRIELALAIGKGSQ